MQRQAAAAAEDLASLLARCLERTAEQVCGETIEALSTRNFSLKYFMWRSALGLDFVMARVGFGPHTPSYCKQARIESWVLGDLCGLVSN